MSEKFNLHTHTVYCDGNDLPEKIVKEAISKGLCAIGFSGHSYTEFDKDVCMSPESTRIYLQKIKELKSKYSKSIRIYSGIEQDIFTTLPTEDYDFVIGSVHYIKLDSEYIAIDLDRQTLEGLAARMGSFERLTANYFELVGNTLEYTQADIIGHFDLITKFNESGVYFDESDPVYLKQASDAMEKIRHIPFEVNTGAMSRGYKKAPYPSLEILKRLKDMGGRVVFSSDCHSAYDLDYGYDDALEYIKAAGFERFLTLDEVKRWK